MENNKIASFEMDELIMNKRYLPAGILLSMYKCFNTPGN